MLPSDGVSTRYTSAPRIRTDTYFSSATTTRPSIWSISTLSRMDVRDSRSLSAVYCSSNETAVSPVENDGSSAAWIPAGLLRSANGYEQLADCEFSPMASGKPRLFMPPRYVRGADGSGGRHRGDIPVFAAARLRSPSPGASPGCLYWSADMERSMMVSANVLPLSWRFRSICVRCRRRYHAVFYLLHRFRRIFPNTAIWVSLTRCSGARRRFQRIRCSVNSCSIVQSRRRPL